MTRNVSAAKRTVIGKNTVDAPHSSRRGKRGKATGLQHAAKEKGPREIRCRPLSNLAPRVGFEPTTYRLTVECSTAELPGNTAGRGVSGVIQMLDRFAKLFFKKNA